jgi:hypothetical protein
VVRRRAGAGEAGWGIPAAGAEDERSEQGSDLGVEPHQRWASLGPARPQINPADTHVSTTGSARLPPEVRLPADVAGLVAHPWTRVPEGTPPLDPLQMRLLPVADLFMGLMWSRPGGLSLRTTWVTPATIWLGVAAVALVGVPGAGAVVLGLWTEQVLFMAAGLIAIVLAAGAGTVAFYGIRQRVLRRD